MFLPIHILTRVQLGINLRCQALRKPKGLNCDLEMRVGIEKGLSARQIRLIAGRQRVGTVGRNRGGN